MLLFLYNISQRGDFMQLSIGSIIYELRKLRRLTQEQLADAIGVSTPAVSKWETGSSYPDIILLPRIARFLGTNVDTLLSFENELTDEQVLEIIQKCSQQFITEYFEISVVVCNEYLKEYPNNLFLKYNIALLFQLYIAKANTEEKRKETINKAINLLEASSQSEKMKIRLKSLSLLSSLYMATNEFKKVEDTLKEIPKVEINPNILFSSLYQLQGEFEKAQKLNQQNLLNEINNSILSLTSMAQIAIHQNQLDYVLKLTQTHQKIIVTFELESYMIIINYHLLIKIYSVIKDQESVLYYLEEYIGYIIKFDIDSLCLTKSDFFSLIDLPNTDFLITTFDYKKFTKKYLLDILKVDKSLDFIRDTDQYKSLIKKLEDTL